MLPALSKLVGRRRRGAAIRVAIAASALTSVARAENFSLVIGVDGMGSYGFEAAATPNMHAVENGTWATGYRGAYTLSAYTGGVLGTATQQPTLSGPGWSTIHSGTWTDQHGVTDNTFAGSRFAATPSYLKILESKLPSVRTSDIVSWNPIDQYILAADGTNRNVDSRTPESESDTAVATEAASQLTALSTNTASAMFIHFDGVDEAGHASGAYSLPYQTAVATADSEIGTLLSTIKARPTFAGENWQIMVVADHGHIPTGGHGAQSQLERTVPILISSKGVAAGNATTAQRTASEVDIAPTVLAHFGVAAPGYMAGTSLSQMASANAITSLGNGLVSHLGFDGNADGSFAGNGGTVRGTVQYAAGKFGQAAVVGNYGSGSVSLKDDIAAAFGTDKDFALSVWMKYDSATGDPAFLSNKDWKNGANTGINLSYQAAGNGGVKANTKADVGTRQDIAPFGGLDGGAWHNVVLNVDRGGLMTLYVDGAVFGDATSSAGSLAGLYKLTLFNDGTGAYTSGAFTNLMIDEFSAWNRLLTPAEIGYLSTSPLNASSLPEPGVVGAGLIGAGAAMLHRRRA